MYRLSVPHDAIRIDGFYGVHDYSFGKDFTHPPESHPFFEMVAVDEGAVVSITSGVGVELVRGQAVFHEPGEVHCHVSNREVANRMLVVLFDGDREVLSALAHKTFTLDKTERMLLKLFFSEAANTRGMLSDDFEKEYLPDIADEKFGASQLMRGYFTEFLIRLLRDSRAEEIRRAPEGYEIAQNSLANLILDYLTDHPEKDLSLDDLCRRFHLGKSGLSEIFRKVHGESPMHRFAAIKLEEAKRLLRETDLTVGEIAEKLSYGSIHAFSRTFTKAVGAPPTEYRKKQISS